MAHLGSELPLPFSGKFCTEADLWVNLGGLRRLTQLLGDTGLLAREQSGLQFLSQQEVMFGFLHLSEGQLKDNSIIHSFATATVT